MIRTHIHTNAYPHACHVHLMPDMLLCLFEYAAPADNDNACADAAATK